MRERLARGRTNGSMEIELTKLHGCENDYLFVDCTSRPRGVAMKTHHPFPSSIASWPAPATEET